MYSQRELKELDYNEFAQFLDSREYIGLIDRSQVMYYIFIEGIL